MIKLPWRGADVYFSLKSDTHCAKAHDTQNSQAQRFDWVKSFIFDLQS